MVLDGSDNAVVLGVQGRARSSGSATPQLKHSLWVTWSELAIEHEAAAWRARSTAPSRTSLAPSSDPLDDEFRASLQAVTTAALALDALYAPVKQLAPFTNASRAPRCPGKRTARSALIREALKRAFRVGKLNKRWDQEFKWLFGLRDGAVHYRESAENPAPHPRGVMVSEAHSTYCAEAAKRAVDLLMEVLHLTAGQPKPDLREAVNWSAGIRAPVRKLDELRDRNRGDQVRTLSGNQSTTDSS